MKNFQELQQGLATHFSVLGYSNIQHFLVAFIDLYSSEKSRQVGIVRLGPDITKAPVFTFLKVSWMWGKIPKQHR